MRTVIFLFFLLSIVSCRRETNTQITVNGKVINRVTGLPVPNVRVKLKSCEDPSFYVGTCADKEIVYTNTNGEFQFSYTKLPGRYYVCQLYENDYYSSNSSYNINNRVELSDATLQNITLNVVPIVKIWENYYNTSCFDSNDLFTLYRQNQIPNFNWGSPFQLEGCTSYNSLGYGELPMGYYYFHWQVTKNSITQNFYDTIYLDAFEDTVYVINY